MFAPPANNSIWAETRIPVQPQLQGSIDADVCVVGLGGSGLAAIRELLDHGKRVVGIDAGRIANGAAGSNGGFLLAGLAKFYHETVALIGRDRAREIYGITLEEIQRMCTDSRDCIHRTGSLRIGDDGEFADCMAHMDALRSDGFDAEPYEGSEGRGLLLPTDAVFHPMEYTRQDVAHLLSNGAYLFENTPAMHIASGNVQTPEGNIDCKNIIVAVDGKLDLLFPQLRPDVTTHRLQMLSTDVETGVHFPRPVYMRYGFDYLQQLPDGRIAMGGCRDMHASEEITMSGEHTESVQASIEAALRRMGVQAPVTRRWAASVAYTTSGLPMAEEVAENTLAIGAYSATGNVVGRRLGRAAAWAIATGDRSTLDLFTKQRQ